MAVSSLFPLLPPVPWSATPTALHYQPSTIASTLDFGQGARTNRTQSNLIEPQKFIFLNSISGQIGKKMVKFIYTHLHLSTAIYTYLHQKLSPPDSHEIVAADVRRHRITDPPTHRSTEALHFLHFLHLVARSGTAHETPNTQHRSTEEPKNCTSCTFCTSKHSNETYVRPTNKNPIRRTPLSGLEPCPTLDPAPGFQTHPRGLEPHVPVRNQRPARRRN